MTPIHPLQQQEEQVASEDQAHYQSYTSPTPSADEEEDDNDPQRTMVEGERQPLDHQKHSMTQYTDTNNNNNSNNNNNGGGNEHGNSDGIMTSHSTSTPSSPNAALQRLVLVAAATAATLGYDVGIMAAAIQPMEDTMHLNGVQKEVAMGSLNFVAALGALLGGKVANDYGRKYTVKVCCWIFVVGTILMAGAPGYWSFLLGRVVTGTGVGVSFVAAPVYLSEVAPTDIRGRLNTVFDVAINGGILLGYVLGFLVQLIPHLQPEWKWRLMLILGINLPIMVLWNLESLPESPRWLVMKGQSAAATEVLRQLSNVETHHEEGTNGHVSNSPSPPTAMNHHTNGDRNDHRTDELLRMVSSMEDEVKIEREDGLDGPLTPMQALCQCRVSSAMRLAIAIGFWQQITGTEAVLYYSADFLQHAGLESPTQRLFGNCFVGLCKLAPELVGMHYVDTFGRRPLMLLSAVSLVISTFLLSAAFYLQWNPLVVVLLLCAIMASFSIGLGPFSFLVASERLGLSERATGMTLCAATNRCTSGTVALTAVSMYQALGSGGLFAIYGLVGLASLPFYYFTITETAGQSLEELSASNTGAFQRRRQDIELKPSIIQEMDDAAKYHDADPVEDSLVANRAVV